MNFAATINESARMGLEAWMASLLDGGIALAVVAMVWSVWGRRLQPRIGAWLFSLVLLKCFLCLPVHLPWLTSSQPSPEQAMPVLSAESGIPAVARSIASISTVSLNWESWVMLGWFTGMGIGGLRLVMLWRRTQRVVDQAQPIDPSGIEGLASLTQRSGYRRKLRVCLSNELHGPAVTGVFRPTLILPTGLQARLNAEQFRWMLAHELSHLAAGDALWQCLEAIAKIIGFWHPVVWFATAQSARLRERACDEAAISLSGASRQSSAAGFVSLIEWSQDQQAMPLAGLGMGAAGREASWRVRLLAQAPVKEVSAMWRCVIILICLTLSLPSFRLVRAEEAPTGDKAKISELQRRVADLERQLQSKSRLEGLREKALLKTHQRTEADTANFSPEQWREIESIYQAAKKGATTTELAANFQPLLDKYPKANRTGCALLLLARVKAGDERLALLNRAVADHSDDYFLDATSVGGVARLMLAREAEAAGRKDQAARWRDEIRKDFSEDLDFGAVPLVDVLDQPATAK